MKMSTMKSNHSQGKIIVDQIRRNSKTSLGCRTDDGGSIHTKTDAISWWGVKSDQKRHLNDFDHFTIVILQTAHLSGSHDSSNVDDNQSLGHWFLLFFATFFTPRIFLEVCLVGSHFYKDGSQFTGASTVGTHSSRHFDWHQSRLSFFSFGFDKVGTSLQWTLNDITHPTDTTTRRAVLPKSST